MKKLANGYATKADLRSFRKELKGDIVHVEKRLDKKIDIVESRLNQKIWKLEDKFDDVVQAFDQKLTRFKSEILTGIDKVYKELISFREEQAVSHKQKD